MRRNEGKSFLLYTYEEKCHSPFSEHVWKKVAFYSWHFETFSVRKPDEFEKAEQ